MAFCSASKSTIPNQRIARGLRVTIPARRNWFILVFMLCWLGGWTFGEVSALNQLVNGKARGASLFLLFWLGGWTVGGLWAAYTVAWMLNGEEVVFVGRFPACLSVQKRVFGIRLRSQDFDIGQIRRLRVCSEVQMFSGFSFRSRNNWLGGTNNIAFDYGAQTRYFGAGMDDAEAQIVVDALHRVGLL
jgi:hypothetical protein